MPSRSWRAAHPVELREGDGGGWDCPRALLPRPRAERALSLSDQTMAPWLPDLDSNQDEPVNSRVAYR